MPREVTESVQYQLENCAAISTCRPTAILSTRPCDSVTDLRPPGPQCRVRRPGLGRPRHTADYNTRTGGRNSTITPRQLYVPDVARCVQPITSTRCIRLSSHGSCVVLLSRRNSHDENTRRSSTKPQLHNILQCRHGRTEAWSQARCITDKPCGF